MKGFIFGKNDIRNKKPEIGTKRKFSRSKRKYGEKSILRSINMQYVLVEKKDKNGNVCEIVFKPIPDRKRASSRKDPARFKLLSFSDSIK